MIKLSPILEVYITNVCNLSCRGCNRYNNYNFKGHQLWDDYADDFELWATKIDADLISIIGGEPTLNPDLEKWCINLRRLWPNTEIMIASNGTYFRPEFNYFYDKYRVGFSITLHNTDTAEDIMNNWIKNAQISTFLPGFIFYQSNVIDKNGHFTVYDSDKMLHSLLVV
jgi:organic radical activating enzyme